MSLLVVGSVAFDSIETPKGKREKIIGGSANYACLAASYFTYSRMVGVVGNDYPEDIVHIMNSKGIDTSGLKFEEGETFSWGGVYSEDFSERTTTFTKLNVFKSFSPELLESHAKSNYTLLGNIHPELQMKVFDQLENPKLVACDTMNLWINTTLPQLKEILEKIDILLVNDEEAAMLSGNSNLSNSALKILEMGPKFVVIKKGVHGAIIFGEEIEFHVPAFPVDEVVDPTGAGDTFAGGFMSYIAMEDSISVEHLKRAMVAGTILASFCVEDFGVERLLNISAEDINNRLLNFSKLTLYDDTPLLK
ncbi:MAG: sugar kinase [Candidatus Marinimicrobia bacterium]|nr:sugar kinase [Candidatus Neomarinimicrobiota bacterium]